MRNIILLVIILTALISFGIWELNFVDSSADKLIEHCNDIKKFVIDENFEDAKREIDKFKKHWKKIHPVWDMLLDRQDIDDVNIYIKELECKVEVNDYEESLEKVVILKSSITQTKEKRQLIIQNIL